MPLPIVSTGAAVLRREARALSLEELLSRRTQVLIWLMRQAMHTAVGVGLAAPQVGHSLRLFMLEDDASDAKAPPAELRDYARGPVPYQVFANPILTIEDPTEVLAWEGCLSVPGGYRALVPRARRVRLEALNERGEPVEVVAEDYFARVIQHEIDHLEGVLYLDRMVPRTLCSRDSIDQWWRGLDPSEVIAGLGG